MNKLLAIYSLTIAILSGGSLLPASRAQGQTMSAHPIPTIDIAAAVAIATQYITEQNLDISGHFLQRAVYNEYGPWTKSHIGNGPYWQITYELNQYADGGQIFVLVYMDKTVGHTYGE